MFYKYADKLLQDEVQLARIANTSEAESDRAVSLRREIMAARAGLLSTSMEVEV
jgi:hypothetical protein